jgi:predicted ATPase
MLLEWTAGNFKSVAGPVTLPLAPLTLFVGANSSGKSTVLQSILTVMQSLGSPVSSSPHPLIFNGEYLKLGSWKDVLHQGAQDSILTIGFRLRNAEGLKVRALSTCRLLTSNLDELPRIVLDTSLLECEGAQIRIARAELDRTHKGTPRQDNGNYRVVELLPHLPSAAQTVQLERAKVDHLLPSAVWEQYDLNVDLLYEALRQSELCMRNSSWAFAAQDRLQRITLESRVGEEYRTSLRNVLRPLMDRQTQGYETGWKLFQECRTVGDWVREATSKLPAPVRSTIARELRAERPAAIDRLRKSKGYRPEYGLRLRSLPEPLDSCRSDVVDYFAKRIHYLGPLRDDPRAIYALPPVPEDTDVGTRGEFTAAVLQHHHSDIVDSPIPGDGEYRTEKLPLREAVANWLVYMGLVDDVEAFDRGKIGTELVLRVADVRLPLDLTSVGVGVSQVLPSIVMGLLAPLGSTLLLEQPELHLHPKVQSILGDFLLGMVHSGRQCIVESHSEYMVNRLRRRIVEAPGDTIQKLIQLYFVERTNGASEFRSVEPNEYGAITDWPRGFFDQGPDEAQIIIRAAAAKRQQKLNALKSPPQEQ